MPKSTMKDYYKADYDLCVTTGKLKYSLNRFGDHIAKREKYKELKGIDAVHFYLIQKYHWLPSQVRSMSDDDLRFVLTEEMQGWTLPKDTIF
ncbi:hypothetical protein ACUUL3_00210 [Thiovibrio sp. JS02]